MTNEYFAERMEQILEKISNASNLDFTHLQISADPDYVADFGCDANGHLVLMEKSFPLKIADLTSIRYRWDGETSCTDGIGFIRFDFEKDIHLDCFLVDGPIGQKYRVKYHDTYKSWLDEKETISLLEELQNNC
ncbi:MAG: hypothetical protein MJ150_00635 [Clostridia bacterium]|nr:hypothetical protein [Clostridia bacterium]